MHTAGRGDLAGGFLCRGSFAVVYSINPNTR